MCYNISSKKSDKELAKRFRATVKPGAGISPHYYLNGFNHPQVPIINGIEPGIINASQWGLIPTFCKTVKDADEMKVKTLNAKCETVFSLPSFRNSINQNRCLILVDGFYEWRTIGKQKYPYYIFSKDNEPFALGGIYNDWVNKETGEIINTFSIITTPANILMAKIHNVKLRMPLILSKETEKDWLNLDLNQKEISELMKPFEETLLAAYTISKLITNRNENTDKLEIQAQFKYPELKMFD